MVQRLKNHQFRLTWTRDTTKDFIEKLIVDYGTSRGIKIALNAGVPAYAISMG